MVKYLEGRKEKQFGAGMVRHPGSGGGATCSQLPFEFLQNTGNDLIQTSCRPLTKMS